MAFAVFFFVIAMQFKPPRVEAPLAGSFWPGMALAILFICSLIELIRLLRQTKEQREAKEVADEKKKRALQEAMGEADNRNLLIFGGCIAYLYIMVVHYVGFIITTPLFMAVYLYVTGYRHKVMLIVAPILAVAMFLLLFVVATYIPLPRGIGIFKEISVLLY
jgi:Na+-transporting methylmalonyl-CoA/oxaloacetate decarboxylase gamma subunit